MKKDRVEEAIDLMVEMGYEASEGFNLTKMDSPTGTIVTLPGIQIFWSYKTPIGYVAGTETVLCKNEWGPTTGRHINQAKSEMLEPTIMSHAEMMDSLRKVLGGR